MDRRGAPLYEVAVTKAKHYRPKGIGPKRRVSEPITGVVALSLAATALTNHDGLAALGYAVLAVVPWVTSWLADKAKR
jgi:hypothetical protein